MPPPSPEQSWPAWATEPIVVVAHDPVWTERGVEETRLLRALLAPWLTGGIEHVGSTAVPGLAAKPIIDLQAPVADLDVAEAIARVVAPHHWHYVPPELDRRSYRRFFVKVLDGRRAAHLHLMTIDDRWHRQLTFRDALRADLSLATAYAELKARLASKHTDDREAYTRAKHEFVHDVLSRLDDQR